MAHPTGSRLSLLVCTTAVLLGAWPGAWGCGSTSRELAVVERADDGLGEVGAQTSAAPTRCDDDSDCPAGQTCVPDCDASAATGRAYLAQAADPCPGFCQAASISPSVEAPGDEGEAESVGADVEEHAADGEEADTVGDAAPPAPPPALPPASRVRERLLPPVEATAKGDGKLEDALNDVAALTDELTRHVSATPACAGRVERYRTWVLANQARASRLNHRVEFLGARRDHDYTEAESAAVARHEGAYERLTEALLEVCDEDGPELASLEDLDVDVLRHTFHRLPEKNPHKRTARCVMWRELRTRALLDPETLVGEARGAGTAATTVTVPDMGCDITTGASAELRVRCVDDRGEAPDGYARRWFWTASEPMGTWLEHLAKTSAKCFEGSYRHDYAKRTTGDTVVLTSRGETPHEISAGPDPAENGRFVWSLTRPR